MKFRFYEEELPEVGDIVMCRVTGVNKTLGVNVQLIEYDDKEGFVILSHFIKNLKRSKKIANIGDEVALEVIELSDVISLSKKNIQKDSMIVCGARYKYAKKLFLIANDVLTILVADIDQDDLYELKEAIVREIVWKNMNRDHNMQSFDDVLAMMTNIDLSHLSKCKLLQENNVTGDMINESIHRSFSERVNVEKGEYNAQISLRSCNPDGLNIVKDVLSSYDNILTLTSPLYGIKIESMDEEEGYNMIQAIIDDIADKAKKAKCEFNIDTPPKTLRDARTTYSHLVMNDL